MLGVRTALFAATMATSAAALSCLSLDGFTGGGVDSGAAEAVPDATAVGRWCSSLDAGGSHTACFDFDDEANAFVGWTEVVGAVAPDRGVASSPHGSAFASLAGDGGAVRFDGGAEERLVRRFTEPAGSVRVAFDLRADALPSNRGYAFATIAFYASAIARVPDRSLSLVLSSTRAVLTERLREDGSSVEHPLKSSITVDETFHHVEIVVRFPPDGGTGTADATIDGQPALADEPLTLVTAAPALATIMGIFTAQSAASAEVAAHYDDVTVDLTP